MRRLGWLEAGLDWWQEMRIRDLNKVTTATAVRVTAAVDFEDADREPFELFYELPVEFADDVVASPDALLVAAVMPAARNGEGRLAIEGDVCPRLREGVVTALHWMAHWYGPRWRALRLECGIRSRPLFQTPRSTSVFLSGGIDSLAALRMNRLGVPPGHPAAMRDGILVRGFSVQDDANFAPGLAAAQAVADDAGLRLVPVTTNVRSLDRQSHFWVAQFHGAALASVAHVLAARSEWLHLASSYDIPRLVPWGSHPALDGHYGSYDVGIRHDGVHLSRFDKAAVVAGWPVGLENIRVCVGNPPVGVRNCGRCEKCVRTMLALLAIGALDKTTAFGRADLPVDTVGGIQVRSEYAASCYGDVVEPLRRAGWFEHARAAEAAVAEYRAFIGSAGTRGWRQTMRSAVGPRVAGVIDSVRRH